MKKCRGLRWISSVLLAGMLTIGSGMNVEVYGALDSNGGDWSYDANTVSMAGYSDAFNMETETEAGEEVKEEIPDAESFENTAEMSDDVSESVNVHGMEEEKSEEIADSKSVNTDENAEEDRKEIQLDVQLNEKQDIFNAVLQNCAGYNISKVEIAVWSETDGQDDLIWYPAKQQEDGTWIISGSIEEHKKNVGIYYFHTYAVVNGMRKFVVSKKIEIDGITIENPVTVDKQEQDEKFRVNIGNVSSPAGIKSLNVAVWSEKNGQDDLKWYTGVQDAEGQWYVDVERKNHGYDTGVYIIHVYARDYRDVYMYVSGIRPEFMCDFSDASILTAVNGEHSGAELVLENVKGIGNGYFDAYVWSRENGQDDLHQYRLKKEGNSWKASFSIANHKNSTGLYNIHIYYKDAEGKKFVAGASTNIKGISAEELQVTDCDLANEIMKIRILGIDTPSIVLSAKVAVWSEKNGQDDLKWYNLNRDEETDEWSVTVPLANHDYELGVYNIHAYVTDGRGLTRCVKAIKETVKLNTAVESKVNSDQNQITVSMNPDKIPEQIKAIRFAVWSEVNGQDDLRWYVFDKTYTQNIDIKNHKYSTGKYYVHVYAVSLSGQQSFVNGITFQIDAISNGTVKIEDPDAQKGTFRVTAEGMESPSEIMSVRFAVWTKENGQDDLAFYPGKQVEEQWEIDVDTYMHNYESGSYYVHVYAKDERGVENYIGGVVFEFEQDTSSVSLEISNDRNNNCFVATLNDDKIGKDIVEVQFAVWSRVNGQDDLVWYHTVKESDDRYTKTINTANHKNNSGVYYVHAYGILANGGRRCLKTTHTIILNNWEPQVDTREVALDGLSRDYNFLFVSDTHVIVPGQEDTSEVLELGNSRMHYFTNTSGMNSEEQFPYWIQYANSHQVDGLLMGGDIIDYPSESNLAYLKENLNELKTPYVYTFGNHDWAYPWDTTTQEYRPLFDDLLDGSGAAHFMEYDDLVVLTVDDSTYQVAPEALPVVEQALSLGKPVILMMHIPLQTDSLLTKCLNGWNEAIVIGPDGKKPNEVTQKFLDMILADDSPVGAILAGHVHMEDTSQINDRITQYVVDMSAKGKGIIVHLSK